MMATSIYDELEEFIDQCGNYDPLTISGLDKFEFVLDEPPDDGDIILDAMTRPADEEGAVVVGNHLCRRPSISMFEDLGSSLDDLHVDAAHTIDAEADDIPAAVPSYDCQHRPTTTSRRDQQDCSPSPTQGRKRRHRKTRCTRVATVAQSLPAHQPAVAAISSQQQPLSHVTNASASYNEALENLVESMKRTEESRKQVVLMHRRMLTPEQRLALSHAKQRLQRENQRVIMAAHQQQQQQQTQSSSSATLSGFFFSGTNGFSLTSGLEASRRHLGSYVGQVNHRTF